jgi:23S rRNA pseudouridine2604 synthase
MALKGSDAGLVGALCTRSGLRPQAIQRTRLGRVGLAGLPAGAWRFLQGHEKF